MDTNGVLDLTKKRVRRSWSDEEKRSICAQTIVPGVSVAQVARRYAMNANLIFNWLKKPRFQPEELASSEAVFLPVEVSDKKTALPDPLPHQSAGHVVIELAGGHRLTVEGEFDGDALARLLKGLV